MEVTRSNRVGCASSPRNIYLSAAHSDAHIPLLLGRVCSTAWLTIEGQRLILNQMVERLDATFHALTDPTRRAMLARLASGERSIGELAEPLAMSFAGASKHVKVLEAAGLISRRKAGRQQLCRLRPEPLAEAQAWLKPWERLWAASLDRLAELPG